MKQFNRASDIVRTAGQYQPVQQSVDWIGTLNNFSKAAQNSNDWTKQQDLAKALQAGNENEINKAAAIIDPMGTLQNRLAGQRFMQKRDWDISDKELERQWDLKKLDRQYQNALGLQNAKAIMENQKNEANAVTTMENAAAGLAQLRDVADRDRVGPWTRMRNSLNFATNEQQQDLGRISSAVAAIAPTAIQKLKDSGVSGINTLGEFMTYVGLPENPDSQQIAGALPMISKTLGLTPQGGKALSDPLNIL